MAFDWFRASAAKQFGTALANFYIARLPLDMDKTDKKFENKREFVAKKMLEQVSDFKLENRLNLYKKAQLGNAFKWTLKDAGYPEDEISRVTGLLMRQL